MQLVLLHALARTSLSMWPLAEDLRRAGHEVASIDYPSTRATLPELAEHVLERVAHRGFVVSPQLGFVGHSMGGLVYRAVPLASPGFACGPSVMIGSPANGSEVARALARHALFRGIYGPALVSLAPESVAGLPPLPGPTLCIAGRRASPLVPAFWILRALGVHEPSDSTVLVREALHQQAAARVIVDASHTFLPSHPEVRRRVVAFVSPPPPS